MASTVACKDGLTMPQCYVAKVTGGARNLWGELARSIYLILGVVTAIRACLVFVVDEASRMVLLGEKRSGFGAGNIVGVGGKIEVGETPVEAAVRETREEVGLILGPKLLVARGIVRFRFPVKTSWDHDVHIFATTVWQGVPQESDELSPSWYPIDLLPLDAMWDDAGYWLPQVLAGEGVNLTITFAEDNATVAVVV